MFVGRDILRVICERKSTEIGKVCRYRRKAVDKTR